MNSTSDLKLPDDFSLVQGGPLFQLLVNGRLSTNQLECLKRRIIFFAAFTWLPLLLLSAISGQALDSGLKISFLYDLETHVRFLLALPLLLLAEWVIHRRMLPLVQQFVGRGIIRAETRSSFEDCIVSALSLRNSVLIEIALIVFTLSLGHSFWLEQTALNVTTWYASRDVSQGLNFTPAGYWFVYVSLPIYQFIVLRWVFRIIVWSRFLWQVSRLDLYLVPTHPDRAGGLGFLAGTAGAFMPLLMSQGSMLSAMIAERIFYEGATLMSFKQEIVVAVVFLLLLILGPLCVFASRLAQTKREGLMRYGILANRYVNEFEKKWLQGGAANNEEFIGSADIQSLADLNNSFEVIRTMRIFPFGKDTVLQTAVVALLPVLPLTLTMISLEDLVKRLIGILL